MPVLFHQSTLKHSSISHKCWLQDCLDLWLHGLLIFTLALDFVLDKSIESRRVEQSLFSKICFPSNDNLSQSSTWFCFIADTFENSGLLTSCSDVHAANWEHIDDEEESCSSVVGEKLKFEVVSVVFWGLYIWFNSE